MYSKGVGSYLISMSKFVVIHFDQTDRDSYMRHSTVSNSITPTSSDDSVLKNAKPWRKWDIAHDIYPINVLFYSF